MPPMIKWLLPWLFVAQLHANEFPVVIGDTAYNNMPGLAERVVKALQEQGLDATLNVVPGDRALQLLQHGRFALDIIRHAEVVGHYSQLRQISPPVINLRWSRIASSAAKENCTKSGKDLTVVGVKGIRAFEGVIVPKFRRITWAPTEDSAFQMISARRSDVTYWMKNRLDNIYKNYAQTLTVCMENEVSLSLYSYVHSDYEWALPKVEAVYANLFGKM
ncbi:MAG: hypothetical protein KUG73_02635 [Pseudomonadales bacterium]|nr:hypothetical protein [Pseudomonadales bacterium]